jgi:hypothetical protein
MGVCATVAAPGVRRRLCARTWLSAAALAGMALVGGVTPTSAQERIALRVVVLDRASAVPIAGAVVALEGAAARESGADGRVDFVSAAAGARRLTVDALGYRAADLALELNRDTTVAVLLEAAPLELDEIVARGRTVTLRGVVVGSDVRRGVPHAQITVSDGVWTAPRGVSGVTGTFTIRNVTADANVVVEVLAPGYLPHSERLTMSRDSTIRVELAPDPVGRRMIAQQLRRLDVRARSMPTRARVVRREDLLRHAAPTVLEALRLNGITSFGSCIIIDERYPVGGRNILASLAPEEIERVEVIGNDVRVYTFDFVRREMSSAALRPLVWGVCR